MQRAIVHADLDEPYPLPFHSLTPFRDPPLRELFGALGLGIGGQELEVPGTVQTGIRPELQIGRAGQAPQEPRITA